MRKGRAIGHGLRAQPGVLAGMVAPRLVAGEQQPVVPDAPPADLVGQPASGEADRPRQVGVDPLAGGHPVEEAVPGQFDVSAGAAAEMHQVYRDPVGVPLDKVVNFVDVRSTARRERHDHLHRSRRVILRNRRERYPETA